MNFNLGGVALTRFMSAEVSDPIVPTKKYKYTT